MLLSFSNCDRLRSKIRHLPTFPRRDRGPSLLVMINTRALEGRSLPSLPAEALRRALWRHTACNPKPNAVKQHEESLILGIGGISVRERKLN
jgi:hypothetical protein